MFAKVLHWASLKHELYADAIYWFAVKKWESAQSLFPVAKKLLLYETFDGYIWQTNQTKAVTGSLVKLNRDGSIFSTLH